MDQHVQVQKYPIAQFKVITSSIGAPLSQIMTSGSLVGGGFEHLTRDQYTMGIVLLVDHVFTRRTKQFVYP